MAPKRIPPLKAPPNERPNWERLNEGQRRYAWEQYNLARVRRGEKFTSPVISEQQSAPIAPIEHPVNNADDSDDEVGGPIEVQAEVHEHPPDIESEDEGLEYLDDFDFDLQNELMAQVPGTGTAMEVGSTTGNASSAKRKAESAGGIGKKRPGTGHDTEDSGASISGDTGTSIYNFWTCL
uniref:Structural protein n=1 Tax=Planococcus citri densovirus TaxID=159153 RepID=A0A218L3N2_9VIRU|nr:structural protein [Planococcus citri densovirus]